MVQIKNVATGHKYGSHHQLDFSWSGNVINGKEQMTVCVSGRLKGRHRTSLEKQIDKVIRKELKHTHFDEKQLKDKIRKTVKHASSHNKVKILHVETKLPK